MPTTRFRDYYAIIELSPTCTQDEIKRAYRKLARKHHPDVSKETDAAKRFSDLGEAYEVLSDPEKRKAYDELRQGGWQDGQEFNPPPNQGPGGFDRSNNAENGFEQYSDFFESLFGARHGRRSSRSVHHERGEDLHHTIVITLEEAYRGGQRQLQLQLPRIPGSATGSVRTLDVVIPKGLAEGEQIRLRGQGIPGDKQTGDLYLEVAFASHPRYRVEGRDILGDLRLAPWEAVLGGKVTAPTLGGTATVTISPGTQDGQRLRLKGSGLPGNPPGDHYLVVRIVVPTTTSEDAKIAWRQLAENSAFDPRKES